MTANQQIETFVEKLLEEKGITDVGADAYKQMKKDLLDRLEDCVNAAVLDKIPEQKLHEFEALLSAKGDSSALSAFCHKNISNFEELLASTLLSFRTRYIGLAPLAK